MQTATVTARRNATITNWVKAYGKRLMGFVRSRINDLEEAEDVVQDVWLSLARQTDLDAIEQVGSWLFASARNRITDYYRRKRNVPFSSLAAGETDPGENEEALTNTLFFEAWAESELPDAILESEAFWEMLQTALGALPAEQREVFVANELEAIPFRELAEQTGVPVNTLLSRKRYAVLHLRKAFEEWKNF